MLRPAVAAETAVAAENVCIDWPVDTMDEAASPAELAYQLSMGELKTDELPGDAQASLSEAAPELAETAGNGPDQAAFLDSWEGRDRLHVFFMEGAAAIQKIVLDQANKWAEHAKIEFRPASRIGDSDIRVTFRPGQGHKSYVGRTAANRPGVWTMNLDMNAASISSAYNLGVILHEFGHALGLVHEHQSAGAGAILFKTAAELLPYFSVRGLKTIQAIQHNIIRRYKASELKKFSDFDPDSIMLYAFPGNLTKNGVGTKQNTELSAKDKEFIALMYGNGTTVKVNGGQKASKQTLTLGGESIEGKLAAGVSAEFELTIAGEQAGKDVVIVTQGATQVMLSIAGSDDKEIALAARSQHGSYDLMNEVIALPLAAGTYKVTAAHPSPRGGGTFKIKAQTAKFDKPLAAPLKKL